MFYKRIPLLLHKNISTKAKVNSNVLEFIVNFNVTVKYFRTTPQTARIFQVPSEQEVDHLKKKFFNPKEIVSELLKPFVLSGQVVEPHVEYIPRLNGSYWKARLQSVGLLHWDSERDNLTPVSKHHVLALLDTLVDSQRVASKPPEVYKLVSSRYKPDVGSGGWRSELTVPWPSTFSVSAVAPTLQGSHHAVFMLACIKLKMLRLLESDNSLDSDRLQKLARYVAAHNHYQPIVRDFDPEHEIFVDASRVGFGAYLLTNTDNRVRWISESWPEHFKVEKDGVSKDTFDSCFYEFYALIAACYTWKHKFVNKRVLCWSDNQHAVKLVNLAAAHVYDIDTLKRFRKLYEILTEMSSTYNIHLRAHYVNRVYNKAADHLSRSQVEQFRKIVPTAEEKAKKTKKLLFRNPLIPREFDPRNKTVS